MQIDHNKLWLSQFTRDWPKQKLCVHNLAFKHSYQIKQKENEKLQKLHQILPSEQESQKGTS